MVRGAGIGVEVGVTIPSTVTAPSRERHAGLSTTVLGVDMPSHLSTDPERWTRLDLTGTWKATHATDDVLRTSVGLKIDDSMWMDIAVPGHWQTQPGFEDDNGPLLYHRRFETPKPADGERLFAVLDGIFYQADVWLDGAYLGDPEGYFSPHAYDITALSHLDTEHVLSVGVTCSPQRNRSSKRNITGVFQHWDCIDPEFNPGGVWRNVRIERTGPVRIDATRVLCRDASDASANVRMFAKLDSDRERSIRIVTLVDSRRVHEQERSVAKGSNDIDWDIDIDDPKLWWPWSLGAQNLVSVSVEVFCDGELSHAVTKRTGLREVAIQDWTFTVNGERLFVKGANLAPTRAALGDASGEELRRDVELARDAGLDLIRVHGHISRNDIYDAADELGMLIWQDFPLQWGYARQIRRQAVRQAQEAVDVLGHHPSIALWCAHNEPFSIESTDFDPADKRKLALQFLTGQQLPSWNKSILDHWVKRAFEKVDVTRPVIPHSGVLPHLPQLDGTDSHLYFGWYHGDERDLPSFAAKVPRLVRFVSEFGAQAIPDSHEFIDSSRWPDLDWDHLSERHGLQKRIFDQRVPPAAFASFEEWKAATQIHQAELLKHHIETLRRLKYRPAGGFCMFAFNDAMPMVSWSVLDHRRVPKRGFTALVEACRPVIIVAERPPAVMRPGQPISLELHAISDLRHSLIEARVTAVVASGNTRLEWSWEGDLPADDCTRIGTVDFIVSNPETNNDDVVLDLTLECGDVVATNRYTALVRY